MVYKLVVYIVYIVILGFGIHFLIKFKKKPNSTSFNRYDNSRFYRVLIMVIVMIIGALISIFTNK